MCETKKLEVSQTKVLAAFQNAGTDTRDTLVALFGNQVFERKITDIVKTFEDACEVTGTTWNPPAGLTPDELAYQKLKIIAQALNQGWKPDWKNSSQPKFTVYLHDYTAGVGFSDTYYGHWSTTTFVGSHLCYSSKELALYAGTQFRDIYNQFFN